MILALVMALSGPPVPPLAMPVVWVPGGAFEAGSAEAGSAAPPVAARVDGFWLGTFEVTAGQFAEFLNSRWTPADYAHPQMQFRRTIWVPLPGQARRPVAWVTVAEARAFAEWVGQRHGVTARLPTEIEWEWAARAGRRTRYPWGWGPPTDRRARVDAVASAPVGRHPPNPLGLHDMAGNLWEWCDVAMAPRREGRGLARGGSWAEPHAAFAAVWSRAWFAESYRDADVGFRVLIEPGIPP